MSGRVVNLYFSPTHSSRDIGEHLSQTISKSLEYPKESINYTRPEERKKAVTLNQNDILVFTFPVYNGRVPEPLIEPLKKLQGASCTAIPVAVYGNRAFDDSLLEATDILTSQGCQVVAAIGAIAQHTFDEKIGHGRPDPADKEKLTQFANRIADKIKQKDLSKPSVPGNPKYITPPEMPPLSPATSDKCNYCGICAKDCPVGIIDPEDEHKIGNGCIVCTACVKFCPQKAKSFPAEFLNAVHKMLEQVASKRRDPELFI